MKKMKEINKTRIIFIAIIIAVLLTTAYIEFETSKYPYKYGIKVIHGNTIIDGFDISGHEVGIIVDAPNVTIANTRITDCIDGIVTTSNADNCFITSNYIDECVNGIITDVDSNHVLIITNIVRCYNLAFNIGSSNSTVTDNVAYLIENTMEEQ